MGSITKMPTGLDYLPGVSYLPDKIEIEIGDEIVSIVLQEFLDFLRSLTDLMKLMHTVKSKHLRTMNPMPNPVLREIMIQENTGPLYKAWDKTCSGSIPGLSNSVDNLFKVGTSSFHVGPAHKAKPVFRNKEQQKKRKVGLENDLIEITGKKTKPIWHVVGLETPPVDHKPMYIEESKHFREDLFPLSHLLNKRARPINRTRYDQLLVKINAVIQTEVKPSNPDYETQMEMMLAREAGFTSVADHKAYLDTQKPHWYKDMVMEAYKMGILYNEEVVAAFEALGRYYDTTTNSIIHPKPKMCFLIMSMPIWDVCQAAMQKAVEYFLYVILKIPPENNTLAEWLRYRKLPYLVQPPLTSEMMFLAQQDYGRNDKESEKEASEA